jgi:hypothetical protein
MLRKYLQKRSKKKGQAILEFALALPILLLLLFGVIEFGRLVQAWMTVQNAARFGLRYAVTGEFYTDYCDEAAIALGLEDEDTADGDPAGDCVVPDSYGTTARDLTEQLVDWARLPSIRDNSRVGAAGIWLDETTPTSGDYLTYLLSHLFNDLGDPTQRGYFHVTVCSNRDRNANGVADFAKDETTDPVTCYDLTNAIYMDDAGGPGDRVRVIVRYTHPVILPFINNIWPELPLTAWREGIVEKFRTSRVSGLGSQIIDIPTRTPLPPTATASSTAEPPTDTPTLTETTTPTETPSPTATPDCSLYTIGDFSFLNGASHPNYAQLQISLDNNSLVDVHVATMSIDWTYAEQVGNLMAYNDLRMDWIKWTNNYAWGGSAEGIDPNDTGSPTDPQSEGAYSWQGPLLLPASASDTVSFDLDNNWDDFETNGLVIPSDFGIYIMLDNNCPLSRPPVVRALPTPNCDLYSLTDFTLLDWGVMQLTVSNDDRFAANVSRIQLDWNYAEALFAANGDTSLRMDYFEFSQWGGVSVWGSGDGGAVDYDSVTDTSVDSPSTWVGAEFNPYIDYIFRADLDKNSETPRDWLDVYALLPSDFGITIDFDNGCQLQRTPIVRPLATATPSCDLIYSNGVRINGDDFEIRIRNDNPAPAALTYSTMTWPTHWSPNMYFDYFTFQGNRYYDVNSYSSPVSAAAPSIALPGFTQAWWEADFGNYPTSIGSQGCFVGNLTFSFGGLDCPVTNQICINPTATATVTRTPTRTSNWTATATRTRTPTRTPTRTTGPTRTPTRTPTEGPVPTSTATTPPTRTPTRTNTVPVTRTSTPSATVTPRPSTPTVTMTPCLTPPDLGGCQ